MSVVDGFKLYHHLFGWPGVAAVAGCRLFGAPDQISVTLRGVQHPIHLRLHTSDAGVFRDIFEVGDYLLPGSLQPRVILDAGANVGLTSVFFANRYPKPA